ncbi:copper ion binding protein, partial [Selenomonadales bacterium OttesenSCG-928-I06]|nr:copper ion binding protein [Selenomonadales bacterium OttesenSCG-928-I06]
MDKKIMNVGGMTCAACSNRIERVVGKLPGVVKANVNLTTEKLAVEYDENQVSLDKIKESVEKAGFSISEEIKSSEVIIPIGGMTCAACSSRIERVVGKLAGVTTVSVNLATEKAAVSYIP